MFLAWDNTYSDNSVPVYQRIWIDFKPRITSMQHLYRPTYIAWNLNETVRISCASWKIFSLSNSMYFTWCGRNYCQHRTDLFTIIQANLWTGKREALMNMSLSLNFYYFPIPSYIIIWRKLLRGWIFRNCINTSALVFSCC